MAIDLMQPPTDEDVRAAAQADAEYQARQRLEREYAAAQRTAQAQREAAAAHRHDIEQSTIPRLAALRGLYERRAGAAAKLAAALAEFVQAENEIKAALQPIDHSLAPGMSGMMSDQRSRLWSNLRTSAGLLAQHADIGAPLDRLADTVARGVIGGNIGAGFITSGQSTTTFE